MAGSLHVSPARRTRMVAATGAGAINQDLRELAFDPVNQTEQHVTITEAMGVASMPMLFLVVWSTARWTLRHAPRSPTPR